MFECKKFNPSRLLVLATTLKYVSKDAFDVAGNIRLVGDIFHAKAAQSLVTNVRFGL